VVNFGEGVVRGVLRTACLGPRLQVGLSHRHALVVRTRHVIEVRLWLLILVPLERPLELGIEVGRHFSPRLVLIGLVSVGRVNSLRISNFQYLNGSIGVDLCVYIVLGSQKVLGIKEHDTGIVAAIWLDVHKHGIYGCHVGFHRLDLLDNCLNDQGRDGCRQVHVTGCIRRRLATVP